MRPVERSRDHVFILVFSSIIIVNSFLFLLWRDQTFVHIDAIAHVNKARGLFDNLEPGLRQLGTVWLPLPHLLIAPLAAIDPLWRSGAAGSLLSAICFIGTSVFLFLTGLEWTGSRIVGWLAFLLFALNPHLIYLFATHGPVCGRSCVFPVALDSRSRLEGFCACGSFCVCRHMDTIRRLGVGSSRHCTHSNRDSKAPHRLHNPFRRSGGYRP